MTIDAKKLHFEELNKMLKSQTGDVTVDNCVGHRYIAAGRQTGTVTVNGTPGNALGAYLDGANIVVNGNGQDAVGDTMNDGSIVIHGNAGDALGYAMRGGKIFIKGNAGYRTGIHMKQYKEKKPVIIVGGTVGSFLGEYLAGGIIVVLNLEDTRKVVGNFTGTGMHGGKIYLRTNSPPELLPSQVALALAEKTDLVELSPLLKEFSQYFGTRDVTNDCFYLLTPNASNPYKQLYVSN